MAEQFLVSDEVAAALIQAADSTASTLTDQLDAAKREAEETVTTWQGDGAEAFTRSAETWQDHVRGLIENLEATAQAFSREHETFVSTSAANAEILNRLTQRMGQV